LLSFNNEVQFNLLAAIANHGVIPLYYFIYAVFCIETCLPKQSNRIAHLPPSICGVGTSGPNY